MCGCATSPPDSPLERKANEDRENMMVAGAAVGAVVGGVIGHQSDEAKRGALIGGGAGALVGRGMGEIVAQRRLEFGSEREYIENEISAAKEFLAEQRERNATILDEVEATRSRIRKLRAGRLDERAQSEEQQRLMDDLQDDVRRYAAERGQVTQAVRYLEEILASSKADDDETAERIAQLREQLDQLKRQQQQLAQATEYVEDEQQRLAQHGG